MASPNENANPMKTDDSQSSPQSGSVPENAEGIAQVSISSPSQFPPTASTSKGKLYYFHAFKIH